MKARKRTLRILALGLLFAASFSFADGPGAAITPPSARKSAPAPAAPVENAITQVAPEASGGPVLVSLWVAELVKMAKAGVDADVLETFVNSAGTFNLDSDQIIYLRDLGVSSEVIAAILRHDADIAQNPQSTPPSLKISIPTEPAVVRKPVSKPASPPPAETSIVDSSWSFSEGTIIAPTEPSFEEVFELAQSETPGAPASKPALTPVREPYPVKLNDPILVYRTSGRSPNLLLIQNFP